MVKKRTKKKKKGKVSAEDKECEIFEVEHKGKTEEKIACGAVPGKKASKKDLKNQDKILKGFIILVVAIAAFFLLWWIISYSVRYLEYEDIEFEVVKEGKIILYKTSLPVEYKGNVVPYNFYLRTDPRKIDGIVNYSGVVDLRKNVVFHSETENIYCEGDWNIAIGNLVNLFNLFGINTLVYNESVVYEPVNDYLHLVFDEGDETEIRQMTPLQYNLNVANCEILPLTERLMIEAIIKYKEINGVQE